MEIGKSAVLPGSIRSAADVGADGASVSEDYDGTKHVTIWCYDGSRFSYDVDHNGDYVPSKIHYTDEAAKLLGKNALGINRW